MQIYVYENVCFMITWYYMTVLEYKLCTKAATCKRLFNYMRILDVRYYSRKTHFPSFVVRGSGGLANGHGVITCP